MSPSGFVFDRGEVAERGVQAVVVEPADVLDGGEFELGSGAPDAIGDQLGLEAVDEAFGQGVRLCRQLRLIGLLQSELSG